MSQKNIVPGIDMLGEKTTQLAEKAGFIFWDEESYWGPGKGHIDWSSEYTNELERFKNLIVKECASIVREYAKEVGENIRPNYGVPMFLTRAAKKIEDNFK